MTKNGKAEKEEVEKKELLKEDLLELKNDMLREMRNLYNIVFNARKDHLKRKLGEDTEEDIENDKSVEKKLIKNLKWICGKNQSKEIVLHSFAHLSESKADPDFTKVFFNQVDERMKNAGYIVHQTPFGYFLDLQIDAPGFSQARVFKNL